MIEPRYDESLRFLLWFRPGGPWTLTAIAVDRKAIETKTFTDLEQAVPWLLRVGKTHNLYFSVNPLLRSMDRKPAKVDIAAMDWLYVDVDPRAGEDLAHEQARALALLTEKLPPGVPAPSAVIFSGGGFQGLWRLQEPITLGGDVAKCEEAERFNVQLELLYGGDHCHNADRILRLPGTVNRPDAKKVEKGRVEALATFTATDASYPIGKFVPAPRPTFTHQTGNRSLVATFDRSKVVAYDTAKLPDDILKVAIVQGCDPDDPRRWPSRSECLFWACCEMVRRKFSDEEIFAIITDPENGISVSVLDYGQHATRYALRQVERAREDAIHPGLRRFNEQFAVVFVGGKCRIAREVASKIGAAVRSRTEFLTFEDFANYYLNERVEVEAADGKKEEVPLARWWLANRNRRTCDHVVFEPGQETPGDYNLWRGFAYEPRQGDCSLFLAHVLDNICGGVKEHYDYLVRWMARAVQQPNEPGLVAVVLRGKMGTGKNVFAEAFGKLFGRHFIQVADSRHVFGDFNGHLRDCVVLFANEAFWAGSKAALGKFKTLITEDTAMSEDKGLKAEQVPNYVHLIMASNEDWVVPADPEYERRVFVLDVGDARIQDIEYFKAILAELKSGGYEALLDHLMKVDLAGFEVRAMPKTKALGMQQVLTDAGREAVKGVERLLHEGQFPNNGRRGKGVRYFAWTESVPRARDGVIEWLEDQGIETTPDSMTKVIKKLGWKQTPKSSKETRCWEATSLAESRAKFCELFGARTWPDEDPEWTWAAGFDPAVVA